MTLLPFAVGTVPGIADRRAPVIGGWNIDPKHLPKSFPYYLWRDQQARYYDYWSWYTGEALTDMIESKDGGEPIERYPLHINPIRNFAHKHAAVLLGEDVFNTPSPLVKTVATPLQDLSGIEGFKEEDRRLAMLTQNIVNEVWTMSKGRSLQTENAILTQFLGGCVFQATWEPWRKDLRIPIVVKKVVPDYFLPIWEEGNPWNLLEGYVVYRTPRAVAEAQHGLPTTNSASGYSIYVEHWTRFNYSIFLDGVPLTSKFSGKKITYDNLENPFGFVPMVYIPHIRTGNPYGESIVEDTRGITKELNARAADKGDYLRDAVHRKYFATDVVKAPEALAFKKLGFTAINLGATSAVTKATPAITTIEPPPLPEGIAGMTDEIWNQALRAGNMGGIAFGEDEGSQRSALTLAFRMWPTVSHAGQERGFWNDGLSTFASYILQMVQIKQGELKVQLPDDWQHRIQLSQQFSPAVPRDREQQVDEVIRRFQAGLISPEAALTALGDVDYIQQEIAQIREWLEFQSELQLKQQAIAPKGATEQREN
jgi:hypothetical protein